MGIKRYRSIAGRRTRDSAAWTPSTTGLLGHRLMFATRPAAPPVWPIVAAHAPWPAWAGCRGAAAKGPSGTCCRAGAGGCCQAVPVPVPVPVSQCQTANCWSGGGGTPSGRLLAWQAGSRPGRMHTQTPTRSMSGTLMCTPKLACTPPAQPAPACHTRPTPSTTIVASPLPQTGWPRGTIGTGMPLWLHGHPSHKAIPIVHPQTSPWHPHACTSAHAHRLCLLPLLLPSPLPRCLNALHALAYTPVDMAGCNTPLAPASRPPQGEPSAVACPHPCRHHGPH